MADVVAYLRSDEQLMLADTVGEFLASTANLDGVRESSLSDAAFDKRTWRGIADMGIVGLHIPDRFGGAGYGFEEMAVVFEELGAMVTPVPLLSSLLASKAILAAGTEKQAADLVPGIASGEVIATLAVFEESHDNGTTANATFATPSGDGWVLDGRKRFVTDAPNADLIVVSARVPDAVGLFVVEAGASGVTVRPTHSLDATRPLGEIVLDGVFVEQDAYLGHAPQSGAIRAALDAGVVALAQEQVGGASRCLDMAVDYAKSRYQFGRAIGSFQAVKHMCADMLVAVEHARTVARHAAATMDDPIESQISVPLAKSVCSDAYVKAAGDNIQIQGGIGFTWEHDAHLYFKRAKSTALLLGSVDLYRDRLADAIGLQVLP